MSDLLSSSFHNQNHLSFLRHPTRILRRTQSYITGREPPPVPPVHHCHLPYCYTEDELKTSVSRDLTTGAFLHHWYDDDDDDDDGDDDDASNDESGDNGDGGYRRFSGRRAHRCLHQQQHSHQQHHHHGFGLWRRWGSCRERLGHKEHSLASVELGSWTSRAAHRRGSTLPLPFCASLGPVEAAKRAEAFEGIQAAIIKLFQRNALRENELGTLQESMRALSDAEAGPLIYEYYKDQLLKKGMVILREKIKNDQGADLVAKLGQTWDYFFTQILPTLQALMYPLAEASKDQDIRNTTLLEFRNIVVLKVGLKETIDSKKYEMPANIRQMLLVLQGLHDPTFLSKDQLDLEKLVACVVVPFLGSRGLYQGGPEPVTKANYRPALYLGSRAKPHITITVSDAAIDHGMTSPTDGDWSTAKSAPRLVRLENQHQHLHHQHHHLSHPHLPPHHALASPVSLRKQGSSSLHQEPSSSHGVPVNHRLKPVMEVLDAGRRHSIVGT